MEFNLYSDRTLTPTEKNRGVEKENKSQLLCIYIQDKTLFDKNAFIEFKTDDEESYITERLEISEDGEIVYQLLNGLMQTEYLQFQVIFTDDYNWVWKSVVKQILIQGSINTADKLAKEYPDFISNAQEVLDNVQEIGDGIFERVDAVEETVSEYTQRVEQVEQTVEEYTQAEESRVQAENLRVSNESQRIANENERVSNEQTRVSNENTRQTQETTRQANESTRQTNEETRKQNEISRQNAETLRVSAENTRASNEAIRQSNESTRQTNENTRESNEATREQNETTRIANEEARVQAETDRATEFATWEDEIDSKADKEYVDKKDTNLQYEIADLKAKLYETVVGVKQLETEYASEIDIPTHITEDSIAYPVLDNTAIEAATIKGHSVVWNQVATDNSSALSIDGNGILSLIGNITSNIWGSAFTNGGFVATDGKLLDITHKYLIGYRYFSGTIGNNPLTFNNGNTGVSIFDLDNSNHSTIITGGSWYPRLSPKTSVVETDYDNLKFYLMVIDLTRVFGSGNEPTSVDDNKAKWAIDYAIKHPEYNAGSLKNVNVEKLESFTANIWDEEWELGSLDTVTGRPYDTPSRGRSKNYRSVIPNTIYFGYLGSSGSMYVFFYDENKNFIAYVNGTNLTFTTPSNCHFIKFYTDNTYGTTYKNDVSIYKSSTNLGYIPYKKLGSLTLPNIDLRGVNDIQDTLEFIEQEDGTYNLEHTKYIDRYTFTGNENWHIASTYAYINGIPSNGKKRGLVLTDAVIPSTITLKELDGTSAIIIVTYSSENQPTLSELHSIFSNGKILNYELATPVTTVLATGLLFDEVSLLINKYGRIEVVNRSTDNANADTTFNVAVKEFKND